MTSPANSPSAISAEGIGVTLGGVCIVDDVTLSVSYGELHAIAGPNGAGKSTLLRAILGLLPIHTGTIYCNGVLLTQRTLMERTRAIAYVPQRSSLDAALAVDDVVAQGRFAHRESKANTQQAVRCAMNQVGVADLAGRNYLELSGGEQRLVLIARSLCTGAKIICLDEPTASLDIANRLRVLELLRSLAKQGYAILCVLHELEDVRRVGDLVTLLDKGKRVQVGTPAQVITPNGIKAVYGVEVRPNDALGYHLPRKVGP